MFPILPEVNDKHMQYTCMVHVVERLQWQFFILNYSVVIKEL